MLNKELPIPLYYQLKTILLDRMKTGEWKANDRLPAEDELAATYGVSKATVRQALSELEIAGIVRREQGRGTFVAEPKFEQGPRELTSFSEEMQKHGLRSSSRVLSQQIIKAETDVAEKLGLEEGSPVFQLKRLRLADGEPMGMQTACIPVALAPNLVREDFESASLYDILENKYGLIPFYARETHFAVLLDEEEAELLKADVGSAGLAAERVTFLSDRRPFELVYSVMRGDRYKIILDLVKTRTQ